MVVAATGCQVNTRITVDASGGGRGVVAVSVTLDSAAVAAIGGPNALTAQLQDADLLAAGWVVTGPSGGPGSTTVVSASHPYSTPAEASALVAELAGAGPNGIRPFQVTVSDHHSFWRTDTTLGGRVDLSCGLACFGDAGLKGALGFPTGVDPGPLVSAAGQQPGQVFTFALDARLRGHLVRTNAVSARNGTLQWAPRLGQTLPLAAVARVWNWGRIVTLSSVAGAILLGLLGFGAYRGWRWRRRKRAGESTRRRRRGLHRRARGNVSETVVPHP
jgi:hypothetical protein